MFINLSQTELKAVLKRQNPIFVVAYFNSQIFHLMYKLFLKEQSTTTTKEQLNKMQKQNKFLLPKLILK